LLQKNIPYILSLHVNEKLVMLSGENILEVINFIKDKNPLSIGFNCISLKIFKNIIQKIKLNFNWGMYLNLIGKNYQGQEIVTSVSPNEYSKIRFQVFN